MDKEIKKPTEDTQHKKNILPPPPPPHHHKDLKTHQGMMRALIQPLSKPCYFWQLYDENQRQKWMPLANIKYCNFSFYCCFSLYQ